jgi:hypothetical protein
MAGLDSVRGDLNSTDIADRLDRNYAGGVGMLTDQHMSSRNMPSQMMGQALSGLYGLNALNLDASQRGMQDYYGSLTKPKDPQQINVTDVLSGLTYGYGDSAGRIGGVQNQMGSGWNDNKAAYSDSSNAIDSIFNNTIGKSSMWGGQSAVVDDLERMRSALYQRMADYSAAGYSGDPNAARTLQMVEQRLAQLRHNQDAPNTAFGSSFKAVR